MSDLLTIGDLDRGEIERILDLTDHFVEVSARPIPKVPAFRGKTIVSLFYEDSTRTRLSFDTAAKRLSADTMNFSVSTSSVTKGESLRDTARTIEAMGIDCVVVRHRSSGVPRQLTQWVDAAVVNAGDGWHAHPTQALLDSYTIRSARGSLDGMHIAIVGDIKHSRVARSNIEAFTTLGATVTLVAPPTLLPPFPDAFPVRVSHDLDAVLPTVDVVYLLRMQHERMTEALVPSLREYRTTYGLTGRREGLLRSEALVMHPGPMNRGVEIDPDVADGPRSVIVDQVRNGVSVRMAVLFMLLGAGSDLLPTLETAEMTEASLVIKGGRLVDATGVRSGDVVIGDDGRVLAVGPDLDAPDVLDAGGCIVSPGFVDLHSHLREPGQEDAETVQTGARGAAAGGYTCILAMPNTTPAIDNVSVARDVLALGEGAACEVLTSAAITVGRAGETLTPMAELAAIGVRVFTDDGSGVQDTLLMRRAMEYASALDVVLAQHCEDDAMCAGGHMHEGEWSSRLGIAGQPAEAEELMVMRDIALARLTGARVHFQHLSTAGSVAMVRAAKGGGMAITCESTTHHFTLTHERCSTYDPVFKVNPPLRTDSDVAAVKVGLGDGTIDCIATDHAPHTPDTKEQAFDEAPPGMLGLETALALALTELDLEVEEIVALMSTRPAHILGVEDRHGGPIREGRPGNLTIFDPTEEWVIDGAAMQSLSRNTPYAGKRVRGRVRHTLLGGRPTLRDQEVIR